MGQCQTGIVSAFQSAGERFEVGYVLVFHVFHHEVQSDRKAVVVCCIVLLVVKIGLRAGRYISLEQPWLLE